MTIIIIINTTTATKVRMILLRLFSSPKKYLKYV
jgi:hypothetical protein